MIWHENIKYILISVWYRTKERESDSFANVNFSINPYFRAKSSYQEFYLQFSLQDFWLVIIVGILSRKNKCWQPVLFNLFAIFITFSSPLCDKMICVNNLLLSNSISSTYSLFFNQQIPFNIEYHNPWSFDQLITT
jgi:hypothetical protein